MDKYTAEEEYFMRGYEKGYKKGYEAGKKDTEDEIKILKQKRANIFEILDSYERGRASALKWIPVSERLPERSGTYLVTTTSGAVTTARFYEEATFPQTHYRSYEWHRKASWSRNRNVTHWMPLPEPPKEERQ